MQETVSSWFQELQDRYMVPFLKEKGIKPVKDLRVLLSFPSSGGESVEPDLDKKGAPNSRAGEAKTRVQYLPAIKVEKLTDGTTGASAEALAENADYAKETKEGKLANEGQPLLLVTPARHRRWAGSQFDSFAQEFKDLGEDAVEVAERIITTLHGNVKASIIENPPSGAERTKKGNIKVGTYIKKVGPLVGLMGEGWTAQPGLIKFVHQIITELPPPDGAAVNLKAGEKPEKAMTSVTLVAADGTEFAVSARRIASGKQAAAGKLCVADVLETGGPFTFKERADKKEGKEAEA